MKRNAATAALHQRVVTVKKEKVEAQTAARAEGRRADAAEERLLCATCCQEERRVMLAPCSHCVLCEGCAERVEECPMCRTPIQSRRKLILS